MLNINVVLGLSIQPTPTPHTPPQRGLATAVYKNCIRDLDDRFMLTAADLWNFYLMTA
ncbi:hypothetical protein IQ277_34880 [Nostocales cyanobacterium LEGE 12452]|nr:hypothetical protein [Nostocales cyanobacterium LEGE 12452]